MLLVEVASHRDRISGHLVVERKQLTEALDVRCVGTGQLAVGAVEMRGMRLIRQDLLFGELVVARIAVSKELREEKWRRPDTEPGLAKQINSYIGSRELTSSRSQAQRWTVTDPAAELISVVHRFIDEVNSGNGEAALGRLTQDVCIVEDIAPFRWTGPQAGGQWLAAMGTNAQRLGVEAITMTPGEPRRIEIEDDHGYCIMPGRVMLEGSDTTLYEDGLLTFAMRFEREQWKISAMTWTGDRAVET